MITWRTRFFVAAETEACVVTRCNRPRIVAVLRERYGFASDDVPHLDLLGGEVLDEQGQLRPLLGKDG